MPLKAVLRDDIEPAELLFKFGNGSVGLDLVATVGERWRRCFERLRTPEDLGRWLVAAGLTDPSVVATARDIDEARILRSAVFDCVEARRTGRRPSRALDVLNAFAARPPAAPALTRTWSVRRFSSDPVPAALGEVARDAIDLLATVDPERIRLCAARDCSRLFVDRSRPGARRWCDSTGCGNKAKTASYRRRRKRAGLHPE